MDPEEFQKSGQKLIDYVISYRENVGSYRVTPVVEPMFLQKIVPLEAPEKGEPFDAILKDFEEKIVPGLVHWLHPHFHAYLPSGASYPSILADILGDVLGIIGFSWASGPACSEMEGIVLDWLGKMMGLPAAFLQSTEDGNGGGCIQTSASECALISILAARALAVTKLKQQSPNEDEGVLLSKLVGYCSKEAHSCMEKGSMLAFTKIRILDTDAQYRMTGEALEKAIQEDLAKGLVPFFCCATVGTTSCASVDPIKEIGPICATHDVWLHVDAAYLGCAQICEEFRDMFEGIEHAMSVNVNPNKWLLTNFDCSCFWVRDRFKLTQALVVDPLYLQHSHSGKSVDYRHWGIPLSRRWRSLKLWFVFRIYGVEGLQNYIRHHCQLAKIFEGYVKADDRFQLLAETRSGLVAFRLKKPNADNQKLLSTINQTAKIHMVPAMINEDYVIRFVVCQENSKEEDIKFAWDAINEALKASEVSK